MKIAIISDSHSRVEHIFDVIEKEQPDKVFFLGDVAEDIQYIDTVEIIAVCGNNEFYAIDDPDDRVVEIYGKKIFLTHGHWFSVKRTQDELRHFVVKMGYDVGLFGHTHQPYMKQENGVMLFNPGALFHGQYGILEISRHGKMHFEHRQLKGHKKFWW